MAYSQDYIKRMIEQFGEFLLGTRALTREERYPEALEKVNEMYRATLNMDSDFIDRAPDDYLVLMTSVGRVGDIDKCLVLTDLLDAEAEVFESLGDYARAHKRYIKAVNVLTSVALSLTHRPTADHTERVDAFVEKLKDDEFDIPFATKDKLFQFYERANKFGKAENFLFELLDDVHEDEADNAIEGGLNFYNRLLGYTDHELEQGGLPREEVEEGLRELAQAD